MTLRAVTFDDSTHKIVPVEATNQWVENLIKKNGEPSVEMSIEDIKETINELLAAAPEYNESEEPRK